MHTKACIQRLYLLPMHYTFPIMTSFKTRIINWFTIIFESLLPSSHSRNSVHMNLPADSTVVFIQHPWTQRTFYTSFAGISVQFIWTLFFFSQILHPGCYTELQGQALLSKPIKKEWRKDFFPAKHGTFLEHHPKNSYQCISFSELGMYQQEAKLNLPLRHASKQHQELHFSNGLPCIFLVYGRTLMNADVSAHTRHWVVSHSRSIYIRRIASRYFSNPSQETCF